MLGDVLRWREDFHQTRLLQQFVYDRRRTLS